MSPNLAKYVSKILLVLSVIALLIAILSGLGLGPAIRSTFVMVDPSPDQKVLTPPFDIVVKHEGCGTVDPDTFQAFLESENGERVKVDFTYETSYTDGQRWKLMDYDPKTQFQQGSQGRFFLDVTADESGFCFVYQPLFSFKVDTYIGPAPYSFFIAPSPPPSDPNRPFSGSVVFHSMLHDDLDIDEFTVKAVNAPNGAFGSRFNITVSSVEPNDSTYQCYSKDPNYSETPSSYIHYLELIKPNVSTKPEDESVAVWKKSSSSSLWIALQNGVSAKFRVSDGDGGGGFPTNNRLACYKVTITQTSIPDLNEPNDTSNTAIYLKKGTSIEGYMVNVLDANGEPVGLDDWFQIDHKSCVDDCFVVTLPVGDTRSYCINPNCDSSSGLTNSNGSNDAVKADLKGCTKPDYDNLKICSVVNDKRIEVCAFFNWRCNLSEEYGYGDGKRYWWVHASAYDPYGDVSGVAEPQYYEEKYKVEWFENCQYTHDSAVPPNCIVP